MDMFFETAPLDSKRRVHFHAFMDEVHEMLFRWRTESGGRQDAEPLVRLATEIAGASRLLCFDEFQVEDLADAMILWRLFSGLFDLGVVMVATANFPPEDLYKDGLQRERFDRFIALLNERLDIVSLADGPDYRLDGLKGQQVYHTPLGRESETALEAAFADLSDGEATKSARLSFKGRALVVPRRAKGTAFFTFAQLCEAALGPADYLAIAAHFDTLILAGVPSMGPDRRNEARRLRTLIEILYEHRVKLVCSAESPPESLYPEGPGAQAFKRAVSRLIEMQSEDYLTAWHVA